MSDFSELCPLFDTGVFKEITFPNIAMTGVTASGNAMLGTLTFSKVGYFTFGRTVVVMSAFLRRVGVTVEGAGIVQLMHHTSETAAGTVFGTFTVSTTGLGMDALTWAPMAVSAKTFTSSEILGFTTKTGTALSAGVYDLMLRYKEK